MTSEIPPGRCSFLGDLTLGASVFEGYDRPTQAAHHILVTLRQGMLENATRLFYFSLQRS